MKPAHKRIIAFTACLVSPLAQAHDNSLATGLLAGLGHPLTGLDHLAALVLSGFLIGRLATGKRLALAGLIGALGLGAAGGMLLGAQAGMEGVILLSIPVFLAFQWIRRPGQMKIVVTVMGLFMVAHGWAHGVEMNGMAQAFVPGFLLTSFVITGLSVLFVRQSTPSPSFRRRPESSSRLNPVDSGLRRNDNSVCHVPQGTFSTAGRSHLA